LFSKYCWKEKAISLETASNKYDEQIPKIKPLECLKLHFFELNSKNK
jgi:hypothetical protein